jgi:hypothetical protein
MVKNQWFMHFQLGFIQFFSSYTYFIKPKKKKHFRIKCSLSFHFNKPSATQWDQNRGCDFSEIFARRCKIKQKNGSYWKFIRYVNWEQR